jgi:tellurite methyltransferase
MQPIGDGLTSRTYGALEMKKNNPYDKKYMGQEYYWGKRPSAICDKVIKLMHPNVNSRPKLLDLGCGEGRNAVYFAENGFDAVGLDASQAGLKKTRKYAEEAGVHVETIHADIMKYEIIDTYDVIFSTGTLHYLPLSVRNKCFQNYKDCTAPNGLDVFSVFVSKPFIPRAPDAEENVYPYKSGELMSYYWDWEILHYAEEIFDCGSGGVPHKHAVNRMIARRYVVTE